MTAVSDTSLRNAGALLIAASVGFIVVFSYLASAFGYPDILDRSAAEVLPRLLRGGRPLRVVWFIYAALPLAIAFAAAVSSRVLERGGRGLARLGAGSGIAAGTAMSLGLVRWPTFEWALAKHWDTAPAPSRAALAALFDASNSYLGNVVGEFVGEVGLAIWFIVLAIAFRRGGRRHLGSLGLAAGFLVAVAALRNITSAVELVSAVNNVTLPLWLITLGVVFMRERSTGPGVP